MKDSPAHGAAGSAASAPVADQRSPFAWFTPVRIALIVWGAISLIAIIARWPAIEALRLSDTDDAMRMVQVRDLLAGQGWWDLSQYRVNPAGDGVIMHWSRIVDAPLALGLILLEPLFGVSLAERIVMTLWPLLLGAALCVACVIGYRDLSDRRIAYIAPLFLVTSVYITIQFRPLRVDHHGWQILLAMVVMMQALRPAGWKAGLGAGFAAAALLAVSIEGLPIAALFAGLAALRWALHGLDADRARFCGYMAALAGGAIAFQFATRGPAGLVAGWCDSLSAPYLAALGAAAIASLLIAYINPARFGLRCLSLGGAALVSAGALVWTEPQCASGPFASLDPIVVRYWYQYILEGQPVWASKPLDMLHVILPSLIGLTGSLLAWRSADSPVDRRNWATVIVALAGAAALSLIVLRSASTAHLFAVPGCAWLGLRLWAWARAIRATVLRILASVASALTLPLVATMVAGILLTPIFPELRQDQQRIRANAALPYRSTCLDPAAIRALNRFPATILLTPIDLGAPLIFWTPHSLVATGHHRNGLAMADTIRVFTGKPDQAEALVRKHRATMILFCRTANDFAHYRRARPDALAALLYADAPPAWLEAVPVASEAGLSLWRVKPAAR